MDQRSEVSHSGTKRTGWFMGTHRRCRLNPSLKTKEILVSRPQMKEKKKNEGRCTRSKPLEFENKAVVKIAVEPLHPSDLPKMAAVKVQNFKTYPALQTKVG